MYSDKLVRLYTYLYISSWSDINFFIIHKINKI